MYANIKPLNERSGVLASAGSPSKIKQNTTDLALEFKELKNTEKKMRLAEKQWRTTFDSISDLVSVHDKNFKVVRVNKAFANFLRMTPQKIIGKRCYELMHGERGAIRHCSHREVLKTGKPSRKEFFDPHLGIYLEVLSSPVFTDKGEITSTVHVCRDITERKKAEEKLRQFSQEIETFAYFVHHDLQAPLVTIQGFAAALKKDLHINETAKVEEDVRLIDTGISKMQHLLITVLEYGRTHRLPLPTESLPFKEIVQESLAQVAEQARSSVAAISVAETFPIVNAERTSMVQVLNNLIVNAIQYRDKSRRLTIEIGYRLSDDEVTYYVRDNGIGISSDEKKKVFEAFYRGSSESQGSGLGLTIVKRVLERHGGRVWIESKVGKGTTVCFTLASTDLSRGQ